MFYIWKSKDLLAQVVRDNYKLFINIACLYSREDAEDIVQDSLLYMTKALDTIYKHVTENEEVKMLCIVAIKSRAINNLKYKQYVNEKIMSYIQVEKPKYKQLNYKQIKRLKKLNTLLSNKIIIKNYLYNYLYGLYGGVGE